MHIRTWDVGCSQNRRCSHIIWAHNILINVHSKGVLDATYQVKKDKWGTYHSCGIACWIKGRQRCRYACRITSRQVCRRRSWGDFTVAVVSTLHWELTCMVETETYVRLIQMIKFVLKLLVFYTVLTRFLGVPVYPDRCFEGMGREIENERYNE